LTKPWVIRIGARYELPVSFVVASLNSCLIWSYTTSIVFQPLSLLENPGSRSPYGRAAELTVTKHPAFDNLQLGLIKLGCSTWHLTITLQYLRQKKRINISIPKPRLLVPGTYKKKNAREQVLRPAGA